MDGKVFILFFAAVPGAAVYFRGFHVKEYPITQSIYKFYSI